MYFKYIGIELVGFFFTISVLFSLLIGYFVLNEKITKQKILGVIVVITGIAINIYGKTTIES